MGDIMSIISLFLSLFSWQYEDDKEHELFSKYHFWLYPWEVWRWPEEWMSKHVWDKQVISAIVIFLVKSLYTMILGQFAVADLELK